MTTLAQRIKDTPLAPYVNILDSMTREQKEIVVTYITESMDKPKSNKEIIQEKFKHLNISPEIVQLRGCLKLSEKEQQDERTKYILGL